MADTAVIGDAHHPLAGVRVVEIAGLGPVPLCAMLLSQLGADVVRVEQPGGARKGVGVDPSKSAMHRGRAAVQLDLKSAHGIGRLHTLLDNADVLLEGMRPGAAERLGLAPETVAARWPRLVFARLAGWDRASAEATTAGHDINYAAAAGLLGFMGPPDRPPLPPLALGADFPGGMMLALRIVAALHARSSTGRGSVVDQSLVGAAEVIASTLASLLRMGLWSTRRGGNVLDGGAPYYRCYATADGEHVAVGALEDSFWAELVARLALADLPDRRDRANWPRIEARLASTFAARDLAHWEAVFAGSDACVTSVRSLGAVAAAPPALPPESAAARRNLDEIIGAWGRRRE